MGRYFLFSLFLLLPLQSRAKTSTFTETPNFTKDFSHLKNWKTEYFGKWLGDEDLEFMVTFPQVRTDGISRLYSGQWFNRIKRRRKTFLISGDYEFIYYKFSGLTPEGNFSTYHFYNLRLNGQVLLGGNDHFYGVLRNLEIQQSNFSTNYGETVIAPGADINFKVGVYSLSLLVYTGPVIRVHLASFFPGLIENVESFSGIHGAGGIELHFKSGKMNGYIRNHTYAVSKNKIYNKTSARMGLTGLIFKKDSLWLQLDIESSYGTVWKNMIFVNYAYKF